MTAPNPIDNEDLYESLLLPGGLRSPGKLTLSGHDRTINWDVKAGNGQAGATTTRKGTPPVEFTASHYLVKDVAQGIDDFAAWPAYAALLKSTISGAKPQAIDVYHPDLAANDIKSVVLSSIGGAIHDGKGGITYVVKLLEYKPPRPLGGTPTGSKASAATDPNAAAKAEIARLTAQYQATPFG